MRPMRAATACVVLAASCTACTSFTETVECSSPPLVAVSGSASQPLLDGEAIELWRTNGESEVLTDDRAASWPAISPDGETVALALGEGEWSDVQGWDSSRVALLSVDSGETALLSREVAGAEVAYLQWSASGAEIAFARSGPDIREIVAVDVESGEEHRLLQLSDGQFGFTLSPNGTEMLVPTHPDPAASTTVELRRYFLDSGHHIVLTTSPTGIGQVAWSPGGRWVAMEAVIPETTRHRLYVIDVDAKVDIGRRPVDSRGPPAGRAGVDDVVGAVPALHLQRRPGPRTGVHELGQPDPATCADRPPRTRPVRLRVDQRREL